MKYLPFENITYQTKLSPEEVIRRLQHNTESEKVTILFAKTYRRDTGKPYEGKVEAKAFDIRRVIMYKNSFLPRIKGEVLKDKEKTMIKVKMSLDSFVLPFMIFFLGFVGMIFITLLISMILSGGLNEMILFPSLMFVIIYGLSIFFFKYESRISQRFLKEIFEAEIT